MEASSTRTAENLAQSHAQARRERWKLLESAPDAMVIVDRDGRIKFANSHTERMFGYAPSELIGQSVEVLAPEAVRQSHVRHRAEYSAAPRTREMGSGLELNGRRKDGSTFPIEISLSPMEASDGHFVVAAVRDTTERKRIQEALRLSEERFRRLTAEVQDYAIFMLDPEGYVKTWNEGAQQIKGYQNEEILGKHFSCFYLAEDVERGRPAEKLAIAAREGRVEDESWQIKKDGSRFWASVVITAVHDESGKPLGFTEVTRDITERKRVREAFLQEVTNALLSNLDISKLLSAIGVCVRQVKDFDYATLTLYDSETKMLRVHSVGAAEGRAPFTSGRLLPITGTPNGWAYVSGKPLLLRGTPGENFPDQLAKHLVHEGIKSGCWVPLVGGEGCIGTLNLFSQKPGTFSEGDVEALSQLASQIAVALDNALAYRRLADLNARLEKEKRYLEDELRLSSSFEEIVGESKALELVLKQIETVAATDSTVLILGETGTGKERLARAVHDLSQRKNRAFIKVNCASVPAGLLESELFGHEKGAFTGAIAQRIGRFELAHQGTLFLDEVGEIPLDVQPKLLRVLQERQFERLGNSRTMTTDVRIVAATNRDLSKLVQTGQFRSDLYYRLSVFPVLVPPLRERAEDIPLLVNYFLSRFTKAMGKAIDVVPPETMQALRRYPWPGNVRELEHVIERAVILSPGPELRIPAAELAYGDEVIPKSSSTMHDMEREHIIRVLKEAKGKIGGPGGAAERLGMNRTTLNSRMQKLGISRKDF